MATIEMNMLSVITCGSISVRVFCPGMDKLFLDDKEHTKKYPVIWLLHTDGGAALDWLATPAERIAEEYGIFLIAHRQGPQGRGHGHPPRPGLPGGGVR